MKLLFCLALLLPLVPLPEAGIRSVTAEVRLPRGQTGEFRLIAVDPRFRHPEILAEKSIRNGPFRFEFPRPTSERANVLLLSKTYGAECVRQGDRIRPKPLVAQTVRVVDGDGKPVAGARIDWAAGWPVLLSGPDALLHLESCVTDARGEALLRMPEGAPLHLRIEGPVVRTPWTYVKHLHRPFVLDRGPLELAIRGVPGPVRVTVGKEVIAGQVTDGTWRGKVPRGTETVRVEAEGFLPQVRGDFDGKSTEPVEIEARLRAVGEPPQLVVWPVDSTPDISPPDGPLPPCGGVCGGADAGYNGPPPLRAEATGPRGEWRRMEPLREAPCFTVDVTGLSVRKVRLRADLGLPKLREVEVPSGTDVHLAVDTAGGAGIRVVVREGRSRAPEEISFLLADAKGASVAAEYTPAKRWGSPEWSVTGPAFRRVPNGGVLRLDPGRYRITLLDAKGEPGEAYEVTARPGFITRLEAPQVRPRGPSLR